MQGASVLPAETRCYHCQYDLQGLDPTSNCPECGRAIALTLTFGLESADRTWVRRQAKTMLLLIALPLIHAGSEWRGPADRAYRWTHTVITWLAVGTTVWGCWRLSTPEPERDPGDAQSGISRGLRLCVLAYAAFALSLPFWDVFRQFWLVIAYAGLGATLLVEWLSVRLVLLMTLRCGRSSLTTHARLVMWALPATLAVRWVWPYSPYMVPPNVFYILHAASWWASILAAVTAVALLGRMHEVLRLVADGVPVSPRKS
jgi:hypothetical protein